MRLLLVAPTVDPDDVGESWVAWQWARHLASRHEVTLLTYRKRGHASVVDRLPATRVVEWVEPPLLGSAERLNSLMKPGYVPFHVRARRWIRAATARGERFDVAHQPLPVAMRYPSPLRGSGIPYVLGPVGGGLESPPAFEAEDTAPWYLALRRLDPWRLRHDPLLRATYEEAACVLGIAAYVGDALSGLRIRRLEILSETGLEELPPVSTPAPRTGPLRLIFVGRLIRTKGTRDAIAAMGHLRDLDVVLDVVGDGFDRAECERLAQTLGVADRVVFHGAQPRERVEALYGGADVFVFPSYREPGGNVVFEAMGHALPLVVGDRGGPASAVDDTCGVRVPATTPEAYAADLAAAVRRLCADPELRRRMGAAARARVAEVGLWPAKVDAADRIYAEVAADHRPRAEDPVPPAVPPAARHRADRIEGESCT